MSIPGWKKDDGEAYSRWITIPVCAFTAAFLTQFLVPFLPDGRAPYAYGLAALIGAAGGWVAHGAKT
jgi:hypothetical protein